MAVKTSAYCQEFVELVRRHQPWRTTQEIICGIMGVTIGTTKRAIYEAEGNDLVKIEQSGRARIYTIL